MIRRILLLLFLCAGALPAQVKLSTLTRSTVATGLTDSALTLVTDSASRSRAATIANFRKSLSLHAFDSVSSTGLVSALGGISFAANKRLTFAAADTIVGTAFFKDTVGGAPAWLANQAITLSTAAQPNITSVGTLTTGGTVTVPAAAAFAWTGRARIESPKDSVIVLYTSDSTKFARLAFGGTSSSFPALRYDFSGGGLSSVKADNSGLAEFSASLFLSGTALATPSALTATELYAFPSTVSGASLMGFGTTNDVSFMTDSGVVVAGVPHNKRQFWELGTATNDTVNTGFIGEYMHHEVAINTTNTISNGAYTVIDSLTLTGGDWDCSGVGVFRDTSATTTQLRANVDSVRAATSSIYRLSTLPLAFSAAVDTIALPTPLFRMSLTGTQKVYLNLMAMFSTNKVYGSGGLRCRRIR